MTLNTLCTECTLVQNPKRAYFWTANSLKFKRSVSGMVNSAFNGCPGCQFFLSFAKREFQKENDFNAVVQNYSVELSEPDDKRMCRLQFCARSEGELSRTLVVELDICAASATLAAEFENRFVTDSYDKHTDPWTPRSLSYAHRPRLVSSDPCSEDTLETIRHWMYLCSQDEYCKPLTPGVLPTRVILIEPGQMIRISPGSDRIAEYAVLSHCWGSPGPDLYTTSSNLETHSLSIDTTLLPCSFQDAITMAQLLGYKYLWIDALCIIQDDPNDWKREAEKMADYYYHSSIMLSAARASSCDDGFLQVRDHLHSPVFGTKEPFCLRPAWYSERDLQEAAINTRAWVMQERFLAPRMLHFLKKEIVFECGRGCRFEGYFQRNLPDSLGEDRLSRRTLGHMLEEEQMYEAKRKQFPGSSNWEEPTGRPTYEWCLILEEYTRRLLTYSSDNLSAIAGLARKFRKPRFGPYLCGLWESGLFHQMCWYRPGSNSCLERNAPFKEYLAPSWSWACGSGRIAFPTAIQNPPHRSHPYNQLYHEYHHWVSAYQPRLLTVDIYSHAGSEYFDFLSGSNIEIEGYCRKIYQVSINNETAAVVELISDQDQTDIQSRERSGASESDEEVASDSERVDWGVSWGFHLDTGSTLTINSDLVSNFVLDDGQNSQTSNTRLTFVDQEDTYTPGSSVTDNRELLVLQIEKELYDQRLIWALLLEECEYAKMGKCFKRIGLISLAHYNLCTFMPTPRDSWKVPTSDVKHPLEILQEIGTGPTAKNVDKDRLKRMEEAMATDEWSQHKWQKRRLRLI